MKEVLVPDYTDVDLLELSAETAVNTDFEDYSLWRLTYGEQLPLSVARALRVLHVRDFALRTLMPDITQKFSSLDRALNFTADPTHSRDAYLAVANTPIEGVETNTAALGWFRPLIIPEGEVDTARYDDIDLIQTLVRNGYDPEAFVTAAIEIFDGHRGRLSAPALIEAAVTDYSTQNPNLQGVCVRVGTPRAVTVVEKSDFCRLTSEHGGGVFVRSFSPSSTDDLSA